MSSSTPAGFWSTLRRPIIGLAPMDGVTDAAFRFITAKYGQPDLIFTEFTSVEGIRAGATRLLDDFYFSELERPIIAQLFGADPDAFFIGAVVAAALGFDGVDINMGCPAKNVTSHGAGAALILDPPRAQAIIRQTKAGTAAWANGLTLAEAGVPDSIASIIRARQPTEVRKPLPVSLKTRLGYHEIVILDWIRALLIEEPVAITLHGRTLKQGYTGTANWEMISQAAEIVHQESSALILGNGDLSSLSEAHQQISQFGVDGALIGRASFGNPWLFRGLVADFATRRQVALEHARYLDRVVDSRGFIRIRKHLLDYFKGIEDTKELRQKLMRVECLADVELLLQ